VRPGTPGIPQLRGPAPMTRGMNLRNLHRVLAACLVLALAAPAAALAHGRGFHAPRSVPCRALQNGHAPKRLTADQVSALVTACTTRDASLKAARDAFRT